MKFFLLISSISALFFVSCASTTQSRINKFPGKYSELSPDQQSMVEQGRISRGMSKDGVYLALGKPEKVSYGAGKKGEYEQWSYYSLSPVITHRIGGYWGLGSRYGRYSGFGLGPTVSYIPKQSATVRFSGDTVEEYQTVGGTY